jgi:hypothetical protein
MAKLKLSGDYIKQSFTQVDNLFLGDYLASANGDDVKIYLLGLKSASDPNVEDDVAAISAALKLTPERVMQGFSYWEKRGLVEIRGSDSVYYLSVKTPLTPIVKFNAQKFKVFTEETARILPDKILSPNEYNRYFEFMTSSGMEVNAMLLIMQYCKDAGGGRTSTDYVLAVADAWAKDGLLKEKQVVSRIEEMETYTESMKSLFEALGLKRAPCLDDRQKLLSWQNGLGYNLDAVLTAARTLKKRGGMERLDAFMKELSAARAMTAPEIAEYTENKEKIRALCVKLCKNIGVYYGSTDSIAELYVTPWLNLGFEADALEQISKFCFLRNARDFEAMRQMVEKFAKQGLFTSAGIASYVDRQIKLDDKIRAVFEKCNFIGSITNKDRESYRNWEEWGFDESVIFAVAEKFSDRTFPMSAINRALGELRSKNIFKADEADAYLEKKNTEKADTRQTVSRDAAGYMQHEYTEEQLKQAFVNFDNWE